MFGARRDRLRMLQNSLGLAGVVALAFGARVDRPILLVGTGRCGTTLLQSILRAHPEVLVFPGEANELWHPSFYPIRDRTAETPTITKDGAAFTRESLERWPASHEERIRRVFAAYQCISPGRRLFIKSAMISFMIPRLCELFPTAQFLHLYRHPVPVILSYYKKNKDVMEATRGGPEEARILREIAHYWSDCVEEIDRVDRNLQLGKRDRMLHLRYEDLCNSPVQSLAGLQSYLGLAKRFEVDQASFRPASSEIDWPFPEPGRQELDSSLGPALERLGYALQ